MVISIPPMAVFSIIIGRIFEPIILIIVALIIALYLYIKVSKKKGTILAITVLATGVIIKVLKEIIHRIRPPNVIFVESGFSFPSGHTTTAVVFFGLITYLLVNKKYKSVAATISTLIVLLIGFTRIYLRVHWITDVIAGLVVGGIILTAAILIDKKF
jgi:undecaprenyl-diphosphatase